MKSARARGGPVGLEGQDVKLAVSVEADRDLKQAPARARGDERVFDIRAVARVRVAAGGFRGACVFDMRACVSRLVATRSAAGFAVRAGTAMHKQLSQSIWSDAQIDMEHWSNAQIRSGVELPQRHAHSVRVYPQRAFPGELLYKKKACTNRNFLAN